MGRILSRLFASVAILGTTVFGLTSFSDEVKAVSITQGDIYRFDFATSLTPPLTAIRGVLTTSSSDSFGPNESIEWKTFDLNDNHLGDLFVTSLGSFTTIVLNQNVLLTTPGFYALLTMTEGSFELESALGVFTKSTNPLVQEVVTGTVSAVPLPAALPLFAGGLGLLAWMSRRKRKTEQLA